MTIPAEVKPDPPEQETPECQCAICKSTGTPGTAYRPHTLERGCWCRTDPWYPCPLATFGQLR